MKEKIKHYAKEIIYFLIFITIISNVMSLYKSKDLNSAPLTLSSLELINGSTYTFDKEKPILIHFWATWCPT